MFLCLMRHGKAEPFQKNGDDSQRHLTDVGKQRVTTMSSLAKRWWPAGKTAIWSSPFIRARETTIIMSRAVRPERIDTHEAIADGDFTAFYKQVLSHETADVVLVVGHEPYLGRWAKVLTGTAMDFKTGSMAFFDYDRTVEPVGQAKLLLYVQPKAAALIL